MGGSWQNWQVLTYLLHFYHRTTSPCGGALDKLHNFFIFLFYVHPPLSSFTEAAGSHGYQRFSTEPCLYYTMRTSGKIVLVLVYVILCAANDENEKLGLISQIKNK